MRNTDFFRHKKVVIVGLARSGLACARLLCDLGARVSVTDNKDSISARTLASELASRPIEIELGVHSEGFIKNNDYMVISPGVTKNALPVIWAAENKIPTLSEIEVAWRVCVAPVIAVTGSNGKTTVTTLIGRILHADGRRVTICGNIGNPFASEVEHIKNDEYVSLEVSSFQLEHIQEFRPKIAVILNFTPNHLDRHRDMQEYFEAKKRIFMNQQESEYLVLNQEDEKVCALARQARARVVYFSSAPGVNPNQAAVAAVGSIVGVRPEIIKKVLADFGGLEHRVEFVAEIHGVRFINDSKATTVDAAMWALRTLNMPLILIAGGKHKGVDYTPLRELVRRKVRHLVLIGESKSLIKEALGGVVPVVEAASLPEAVEKAYGQARKGDCVLLSPMCSSFDMFSGFEERGTVFKKAVQMLAAKKSGDGA